MTRADKEIAHNEKEHIESTNRFWDTQYKQAEQMMNVLEEQREKFYKEDPIKYAEVGVHIEEMKQLMDKAIAILGGNI